MRPSLRSNHAVFTIGLLLLAGLCSELTFAASGFWRESASESDCEAAYMERYGEPPPVELACAEWEDGIPGMPRACCIEAPYLYTSAGECILSIGSVQPPPEIEEP